MKISTRLIGMVSFATIIICFLSLCFIGFTWKFSALTREVNNRLIPSMQHLEQMKTAFKQTITYVTLAPSDFDVESLKKTQQDYKAKDTLFQRNRKEMQKAINGLIDLSTFETDNVDTVLQQITQDSAQIFSLCLQFQHPEAGTYVTNKVIPNEKKVYQNYLAPLSDCLFKHLQNQLFSIQNVLALFKITIGLITAISLCLIGGLGYLTYRAVVKPIEAIHQCFNKVVSGDLTSRVFIGGNDEMSSLAQTIDQFVAKMSTIISSLKANVQQILNTTQNVQKKAVDQVENSKNVAKQSKEIEKTAGILSSNIQEIVSMSEQITTATNTIASSTTEMSATIQEIAKNCAEEASFSSNAQNEINVEGKLMSTLEKSALEINRIIEIIRTLAEQTNLLPP